MACRVIPLRGFLPLFVKIKTENNVNATMGVNFAPLLEQAKISGTSDVILMQDENGIFVIHKNGETTSSKTVSDSSDRNMTRFITRLSNYPFALLDLLVIDDTYSDKAEHAVKSAFGTSTPLAPHS